MNFKLNLIFLAIAILLHFGDIKSSALPQSMGDSEEEKIAPIKSEIGVENPEDEEFPNPTDAPRPPAPPGTILKLNLTSEDEIMKVPPRSPYEPVTPGKERLLSPLQIIPSDTQCFFKKFRYFYKQAAKLRINPAELFMTATIAFNGTDVYFYSAKELCITIEEDLIIDTHQYDCSRAGVCICGLYYSYVDPNVPQPEPKGGFRKYTATNGLDRKLMVEQDLCVSSFMGHCTMANSTMVEKLDCSSTTECVIDDSYGPILKNQITKEKYGICLQKQPDSPPGENFNLDDYKRMIDNS